MAYYYAWEKLCWNRKNWISKTLAFAIPAIIHIEHQPVTKRKINGPAVLVLAPTRELAQQIHEVMQSLCNLTGLQSTCLFGGVSKEDQEADLARGVDVVVATPGRLIDMIENDKISMLRCSYFVLDEADRMLDMGFEQQLRTISSQIRPDRQTLMFSATWPEEVRLLASEFLNDDFIQITIGSNQLSANAAIKQIISVVEESEKRARILPLLRGILGEGKRKIIVFCDQKRRVEDLSKFLRNEKISCFDLHGNKRQEQREHVLSKFKSGLRPVLVATDVAGRGLDLREGR